MLLPLVKLPHHPGFLCLIIFTFTWGGFPSGLIFFICFSNQIGLKPFVSKFSSKFVSMVQAELPTDQMETPHAVRM